MSTFQDKIAFINGGSRGIGAAIARRLAAGGASVALTYRGSRAAAEQLAAEIGSAGGRALALHCDAADPASLADAIDSVAARLGRIDILVNNAAVFHAGAIDAATIEDFDHTVAVNVRSVFAASQAAVRHMPAGGRIVNISSCNARRMPIAGAAIYAMSKSALTGLVKGLAHDLAPRGITVNNVLPGPVDTDMNPEHTEFGQSLHRFMALQRHGRPEEVAGMVAYLASAEAAFVTGADLVIDGGFAA